VVGLADQAGATVAPPAVILLVLGPEFVALDPGGEFLGGLGAGEPQELGDALELLRDEAILGRPGGGMPPDQLTREYIYITRS
jgi:hypothetical protein